MPPRKSKPKARSTGLEPEEVAEGSPPSAVEKLGEAVEADGGRVLARYRDPLGGHWLILAVLPIEKVEPTPFQRELSDSHARRLVGVIPKVGRFLDPLIAVRAESGGFWTPNGMHRLEAMRQLGARSIVVLLVPEVELAYRILALNTEKAHNLKDKSLEVTRMADALEEAGQGKRPESEWAFEFEEPAYLTIGRAYAERARYSGGAYMPVVRRCEEFFDRPLGAANELRRARAARLIELDDKVNELVTALKGAGLKSAYLKPFVVARLNPLRFVPVARGKKKAETGPASFDRTLDQMFARAEKFDASKVRPQDLAQMGGAPPEPDE
jgi:ParB family chromosome partitioning protein